MLPPASSSLRLLLLLGSLWTLVQPAAFNPSYSRRNPAENENTAYACENSKLQIRCSAGEVIRINRANYGRFSISVCNHYGVTEGWNLQCIWRLSTQIVSDRCDGRSYCEMMANNHVFGDSCPDTAKYVEVKYTCEKEEIPTTTTSTTTIPTTPTTPATTQKIRNGIPAPVSKLTGVPVSSSRIRLTWRQELPKDPEDPTAFIITVTGEDMAKNTRLSPESPLEEDLSYDIVDLKPYTLYNISVMGVNSIGQSKLSTIQVQTLEDVPSAAPTFWLRSSDIHSLEVTWEALPAQHSNGVIRKYKIQVEEDDYLIRTVDVPGSKFIQRITGLKEDTMYKVMVLAGTSAGFSDPNNINVKWKPMWTAKAGPAEPPSPVPSITVRTKAPGETTTTTSTSTSTTTAPPSNNGGDGGDVGPMGKMPCSSVRVEGMMWPTTSPGHWATQGCPRSLLGEARWWCGDQGWKGAPDLSNCSSPWMADLGRQVDKDLEAEARPDEVMRKVERATDREMAAGDITLTTTKLLPRLKRRLQQNLQDSSLAREEKEARATKFTQAVVTTGSNLLTSRQRRSWGHLPEEERSRAAASLVVSLEDSAFQMAATMVVGTAKASVTPNIVLSVSVVNSDSISEQGLTFPQPGDLQQQPAWQSISDRISIPGSSLRHKAEKGKVEVVFVIYNTVEAMLGSNEDPDYEEELTNVITDRPHEEAGQQPRPQSPVLNSNIISASLNSPAPNTRLPRPVQFTLKHSSTKQEGKPVCAFWDLDRSTLRSQWSQEGCRTRGTNASHTSCECDHLTNFAILMAPVATDLSYAHELSLQVITYVGCIISIICLLLSWITFAVFKSLQCDRNTIHKNLVVSLMLAEIVFLAGVGLTKFAVLCSVVAGLLHYLFLAAFAWMCLEGVQLYVLLVQVFENESSKVAWYYAAGYGVPAVIVAVSAAIYHQGYGTAKYCWLTTENYFIMSFVGPVIVVLTINVAMLSMALYKMCKHSSSSTSMKDRSKLHKLRAWVKGAVVLLVLLGLTWAFGLLFLNHATVALAYVFTILNSLQGLFIFIFHCLMNEKVQKEYRRCCRHATWLPDCIRVHYGGQSANLSTSPNASTGSGHNYFSRFLSGRRRKRSTSTNSSTKPFLSNGVNPHRKSSTPVNSASHDSGLYPTTINGYVYTGNNNNAQKTPTNGFIPLLQCPPDGGMAGDLSEVVDCSVVDSEFVTEYCHHDLQVSHEKRRYSTGSEDSQGELDLDDDDEKDRLSALSCESLGKHHSSFVSSELSDGGGGGPGAGCSQEDIEQLKRKYMIGRPPNTLQSASDRRLLEQAGLGGAGPRGAAGGPSGDPQGHYYHSPSLGTINHTPSQPPPDLPPRPNASAPNLKFREGGRGGKSRTEAVRQSGGGKVQRSLPNLSGIAEAGEEAAAMAAIGEADTLQIRPLDRKAKHLSSDYPSKGDDGSTFASSVC